ncbi:MAG: hypothetical protein IJF75_03700 [Clostridia bacterium]|nr:hypothetical protein [Clostridia bacterium]
MKKLNPGDVAPQSGRYNVLDSQGQVLDTIQVDKGNRLPPTQSSEYYYELSD